MHPFSHSIQSQFASSENSNKELRNEVSSLLHQLSQTSQVTLDVKEQEAQIRNEKKKVEQLLLVATADKVSIIVPLYHVLNC